LQVLRFIEQRSCPNSGEVYFYQVAPDDEVSPFLLTVPMAMTKAISVSRCLIFQITPDSLA
jgi:hypothetical protein